jgi:hypothetical protein
MLAELGRRGDAAAARGTDAVREAVHATALHVRRIVGAVSVALTRVTREAQDLVWDYQDVASDLRRPADDAGDAENHSPRGRPHLRLLASSVEGPRG